MSKKNLVGKVFGRLTVLEDSGKRDKYHNVIWRCECSCKNHNIVEVVTGSLTGGKTKSCGCLHKEKAKQQGEKTKSNLIGKQFGKLTVLGDSGKRKNGCVVWTCQCNCPKQSIVEVTTGNLQSGHTQSCGCLIGSHSLYKIGDKIGKLTIVKDTLKRSKNKDIIWECVCDCGNPSPIEVTSLYLTTSPYPSCGCAANSCGEAKIQDCLTIMKINFQKEYRFQECINSKTGFSLPFDFYLPDYNCCIEYDGEQHYKERLKGFFTKEKLKELQERDKIKTNFCKKNNIHLLRIPYYDFEQINEKYIVEQLNKAIKTEEEGKHVTKR